MASYVAKYDVLYRYKAKNLSCLGIGITPHHFDHTQHSVSVIFIAALYFTALRLTLLSMSLVYRLCTFSNVKGEKIMRFFFFVSILNYSQE